MSTPHPDKLSIIIVNDFAHINGGAALVALESAKALAQLGHDVTLFAAVEPIDEELEKSGVQVICTVQYEILTDPDRMRAVRQGLWNNYSKSKFEKLLQQKDRSSTIVHLHGWTKSLSSSVIRAAIDNSFPIVCTLHDYFTACPNGGFFDYQKNEICTRQALSLDCLLTNCDKQGYAQKLYRTLRQRKQKNKGKTPGGIRHFINISEFSLNILKPYLPSNASVHFVPNPIFIDKTEPAQPDKNDRFICVGRLSPEKGLHHLAQAVLSANAKLTVVGDGELRNELEQKHPEIEFTGWLDREQVIKQIQASRALILPSLWYETQGLVVAEAAALGVPSIVPDSCAARDMVTDRNTGLWFKGGDIDDLAGKVVSLGDNSKAQSMGRAAYDKFWAAPPTMDAHLATLLTVYSRILNT
ncbi:MAG: glycosyltransferase family 4 protein [candidate division Zixibacteria bacterium]|nr:glycosyltransferase family 4 protein [candidate division Zixibacteria bacterium]